MSLEAVTPERHAQVLAECERLIGRNSDLEAKLADAYKWRSRVAGILTAVGPLVEEARGR